MHGNNSSQKKLNKTMAVLRMIALIIIVENFPQQVA
jgi:hypothetical protein